jgi:UDP-arabinose 4-epimerase
MTSILVTGGAGFIGSHTCKALAEAGYTPVAYDNLVRGHKEFVRWGPLVVGDILDHGALDEAFRRFRPRGVIHFAGLAYVGESFSEPLQYYRTNVSGMVNLIDVMLRNNVNEIVFSSSCTTYGLPEEVPISEAAKQAPISPYGRSKLAGEQILKDVAQSRDFRFGIFRYFNACGADRSGDLPERHIPETHLIPLAVDAAKGKAPPLQIFGSDYPTADGTCERDYIHVTDLADAHVRAVRHLEAGQGSFSLNLGTGVCYSVMQIVSAIESVSGKSVPFNLGPRRPGDPPALVANPTMARQLLQFAPTHSDLRTIIETTWQSR